MALGLTIICAHCDRRTALSLWDAYPWPATCRYRLNCTHCGRASTVLWGLGVALTLAAYGAGIAALALTQARLAQLPAIGFALPLLVSGCAFPLLLAALIRVRAGRMWRTRG